MIEKIFFLVIYLFFYSKTYAQHDASVIETPTVKKLQGIWGFGVNAINDEEKKKFDKNFEIYWIIKGNKYLDITLFKNDNEIGASVWYFDLLDLEKDTLIPKNISQFRKQGDYFLEFGEHCIDSVGSILCGGRGCGITLNEFGLDKIGDDYFCRYWTGIPESHAKIKQIPNKILIKLKQDSKAWDTYVKFLQLKVVKIKTSKSTIYNIPDLYTKMYLLKNDEVEILEEKDEWLRVRFYGKKIVEGWIKKSDVEMN